MKDIPSPDGAYGGNSLFPSPVAWLLNQNAKGVTHIY